MSNQPASLLSKYVTGQKQDIDMEAMTSSTDRQSSPWAAFLAMGMTFAIVMALVTNPSVLNDTDLADGCCSELLSTTGHSRGKHIARLEWEYFLMEGFLHESGKSVADDHIESQKPLSAGEALSIETHMSRRLPRYQDLFRTVASEHAIDWHLVAAISYQESHWHPKAKSPTGVRGMMMLTLPTAKEMGIRNRLDAEQSVRGGVRYLQQLKQRLPESIQESDRTWMALAAYNVGIGHLYDARSLARQNGLNPDCWSDVRDCLLMLEDPNWHKHARYGYANGSEPVRYVDNIQRYYRHILATQTQIESHMIARNGNNRSPVL